MMGLGKYEIVPAGSLPVGLEKIGLGFGIGIYSCSFLGIERTQSWGFWGQESILGPLCGGMGLRKLAVLAYERRRGHERVQAKKSIR